MLVGDGVHPAEGDDDEQCQLRRVIRADGRVEELGPTASTEMAPGDSIEISTPGGGGFGETA